MFRGTTDSVSVRGQPSREGFSPAAVDAARTSARDPILVSVVLTTTFDDFYGASRDKIARALAFSIGSVSLAEEATDEAMARAFQRWSTVGSYENPAGWVYRTGLNWARSWRRSAFRRRRREERVSIDLTTTNEPMSGESDDLLRALDSLSLDHRSVVVLRHYCDWSVSETAAALGISQGTVKSRNARALEQLRFVLQEREG